jgi:hypothetical protein
MRLIISELCSMSIAIPNHTIFELLVCLKNSNYIACCGTGSNYEGIGTYFWRGIRLQVD